MWMVKGAIPAAVTLAVVSAVTALLWHFKLATVGPEHPVFLYLFPIAVMAIIYGSLPALLGVFFAGLCADYFLYDPLYTLNISSWVEFGDLAWFAMLGVFGVKCAVELSRPSAKIPTARSRYGRS